MCGHLSETSLCAGIYLKQICEWAFICNNEKTYREILEKNTWKLEIMEKHTGEYRRKQDNIRNGLIAG